MTDPVTRPLRILLAEDNEMNRELTVRMLKRRGFEIHAVDDGQALLDRLASDTFDAVLLDIQMPEVDGFSAARQIREREDDSGHRIPLIALTAFSYDTDRERCFEAGMDAYVSKPINWSMLVDTIHEAVGLEDRKAPESHAPVDASALEALLEMDPFLWPDLHDLFDRSCRSQLEHLRAAIRDGDAQGIEQAAHTLKGSLGVAGAKEASALASNILDRARKNTIHDVAPMADQLERMISLYHDALMAMEPPGDSTSPR